MILLSFYKSNDDFLISNWINFTYNSNMSYIGFKKNFYFQNVNLKFLNTVFQVYIFMFINFRINHFRFLFFTKNN